MEKKEDTSVNVAFLHEVERALLLALLIRGNLTEAQYDRAAALLDKC